MPHIATKINCAGDKCGECKHQREKTVEFTTAASLPPQYIFAVVCCVHGDAIIIDGNRLPECLAGELVECCDSCGNNIPDTGECRLQQDNGPFTRVHQGCNWQPATKGER